MRLHLLVGIVLLLFASTPVHAAGPARTVTVKQSLCLQDTKCRDHYAAADELYRAGKLIAAIPEFEAAYKEVQLPVFLYNIGRIHHQLGNLQQAAAHYRRFLGAA